MTELLIFLAQLTIILYVVFGPLIGLLAIQAETGKDYAPAKQFWRRALKNWFLTPIPDLIIIYRNQTIKVTLPLAAKQWSTIPTQCQYQGRIYHILAIDIQAGSFTLFNQHVNQGQALTQVSISDCLPV